MASPGYSASGQTRSLETRRYQEMLTSQPPPGPGPCHPVPAPLSTSGRLCPSLCLSAPVLCDTGASPALVDGGEDSTHRYRGALCTAGRAISVIINSHWPWRPVTWKVGLEAAGGCAASHLASGVLPPRPTTIDSGLDGVAQGSSAQGVMSSTHSVMGGPPLSQAALGLPSLQGGNSLPCSGQGCGHSCPRGLQAQPRV